MSITEKVFVTGEIYHVFSKSIAGFIIFNNDFEFLRMIETIKYYQEEKHGVKFSNSDRYAKEYVELLEQKDAANKLIEIMCYCLMPSHLHLVLKQLKDKGISEFMRRILDSYTRYFNIKHNRKGPLWEGRFKRVLVENDEQLLHLTRYIHLNPSTAYLVNNPTDWRWSSYGEYIANDKEGICKFDDVLNIKPDSYKIFAEDRIPYQRELAKIKHLVFD